MLSLYSIQAAVEQLFLCKGTVLYSVYYFTTKTLLHHMNHDIIALLVNSLS